MGALDDAVVERASGGDEGHQFRRAADLGGLEDAKVSENRESSFIRRQFDIIAAYENGIDTQRGEHAGGVDFEERIGEPAELFEQRAVFVGVDHVEVVAEVRCQTPGVPGVDRGWNLAGARGGR